MNKNKTKVAITGSITIPEKTLLTESILLGKPHTVLPAIMMVKGSYYPNIENASEPTSLYFSSYDLKQSLNTWNGRPVAVNHPHASDTCNSPDTFNKQWVGYVFNARYEDDNGSLKADLWIDNDRGKSITNRIKLGDQIDVSIGAFGDLIPSDKGSNETAKYDYKMTNIVGDHLAVLPDGTGACSWEDGCGIRASVFSLKKSRSDEVTVGLHSKVEVKLKEMSKCVDKVEEESVDTIEEKVQVIAKEQVVEKHFNKDEWLSQAPEDVKSYLVNAMKNYETSRTRHIETIVTCEDVKFCKEALSKIKDVGLLETIASLVKAKAGTHEDKQESDNGVDYQLRSVAASKAPSNSSWAEFKDVNWSN